MTWHLERIRLSNREDRVFTSRVKPNRKCPGKIIVVSSLGTGHLSCGQYQPGKGILQVSPLNQGFPIPQFYLVFSQLLSACLESKDLSNSVIVRKGEEKGARSCSISKQVVVVPRRSQQQAQKGTQGTYRGLVEETGDGGTTPECSLLPPN